MKPKNTNKKSRYKLLKISGIVIGALLVTAFIAQFFIAYPIPFVQTTHGQYHVYKQVQLAGIIDGLNISQPVISSQYKGHCGFYNSDPEPIAYYCDSMYNVVYKGSGDVCNDYNQLNAAMSKAGYKYDQQTQQAFDDAKNNPDSLSVIANFADTPSTADCQLLLKANNSSAQNPSLEVGYTSAQFASKTRGDGMLLCYLPAENFSQISDDYGNTSINNAGTFNCVVRVYAST